MAISREHVSIWREIFKIPGVLSEPFLMFGYQDMMGGKLPGDFDFKDLKELLTSKGLRDIQVLDYFDKRADLKYDMNLPVPADAYEKYRVVMDLGCLEHLFDTRQCLENCLRMVKAGGLYLLHTEVNGYFGHGLHVFNPEGIISALALNNFEILYLKYTSSDGRFIKNPLWGDDVLLWVVAKKGKSMEKFVIPQQTVYEHGSQAKQGGNLLFVILRLLWRALLYLKYKVREILNA